MSPAFDRVRRNGQAACGAVRNVPKLLATGHIDPERRHRLAEAIERNRREIHDIIIELSAEHAEPRLLELARKINALWTALYAMVADDGVGQSERGAAAA